MGCRIHGLNLFSLSLSMGGVDLHCFCPSVAAKYSKIYCKTKYNFFCKGISVFVERLSFYSWFLWI
jgi:hypothetical protein